jgi:hypothetical protein
VNLQLLRFTIMWRSLKGEGANKNKQAIQEAVFQETRKIANTELNFGRFVKRLEEHRKAGKRMLWAFNTVSVECYSKSSFDLTSAVRMPDDIPSNVGHWALQRIAGWLLFRKGL